MQPAFEPNCLDACSDDIRHTRAPYPVLHGSPEVRINIGSGIEGLGEDNKYGVPSEACVCGVLHGYMRGLSVIVGDNLNLDPPALLAQRSYRRLDRLEDCLRLASD